VQGSGAEHSPCILWLNFVEKTKSCDLVPCCNAEHSLFVLLDHLQMPYDPEVKQL